MQQIIIPFKNYYELSLIFSFSLHPTFTKQNNNKKLANLMQGL